MPIYNSIETQRTGKKLNDMRDNIEMLNETNIANSMTITSKILR